MDFSTRQGIAEAGFEGFVAIKDLKTALQRRVIPKERGVYLILRDTNTPPTFHEDDIFEKRLNKAPYTITALQEKWNAIQQSIVIYIGKAGTSDQGIATLHSRLRTYLRLSPKHSGGRAIWQLKDAQELLVCWKATGVNSPKAYETELLAQFKARYGSYPLANWVT
jgi:hypothetical protein